MKRQHRVYEVEVGETVRSVRVERVGTTPDGNGRLYRLSIGDEESVEVVAERLGGSDWTLLCNGRSWEAGIVRLDGEQEVDILGVPHRVRVLDPMRKALRLAEGKGGSVVKAAMPGRVMRVLVEPGQSVEKGSPLLVIEAMKMENEIKAPRDGTVKRIEVSPGDLVDARDLLVELS